MVAPADVLKVAASQIGYREGPNNDNKYGAELGGNHQPWCDYFVSWCFKHADAEGLDGPGTYAYTPSHAGWFRNSGQWGHEPRVGAVVFFDFPGGPDRISHVGIVERVLSDGWVGTIEGNTDGNGSRTGGQVMRQTRRSGIVGYGYPAYTGEGTMALDAADKAELGRYMQEQRDLTVAFVKDALDDILWKSRRLDAGIASLPRKADGSADLSKAKGELRKWLIDADLLAA